MTFFCESACASAILAPVGFRDKHRFEKKYALHRAAGQFDQS